MPAMLPGCRRQPHSRNQVCVVNDPTFPTPLVATRINAVSGELLHQWHGALSGTLAKQCSFSKRVHWAPRCLDWKTGGKIAPKRDFRGSHRSHPSASTCFRQVRPLCPEYDDDLLKISRQSPAL